MATSQPAQRNIIDANRSGNRFLSKGKSCSHASGSSNVVVWPRTWSDGPIDRSAIAAPTEKATQVTRRRRAITSVRIMKRRSGMPMYASCSDPLCGRNWLLKFKANAGSKLIDTRRYYEVQ